MDVAVAGGHGRVALDLTRMLTAEGDPVRSLIRHSAQSGEVEAAGGEPLLCDLELASPAEIAEAIAGADAVVFAAGAGPGSGAARKETVDYGAAVKLIEAARAAGIRRYLMISTRRADPDHPGEEVFDAYLRAKGRADAELARSGLIYTIVRPGRLTDEPPTGRVRVGESVGQGSIPRADVAAVLAVCLRSDQALDRAFEVISGDVPIAEAVPPTTARE
jgi:uncharacterized protein YbjT (DUF2867 family)